MSEQATEDIVLEQLTEDEFEAALMERLQKCLDHRRFMAAFWVVEEGQVKYLGSVKREFLFDDFLLAATKFLMDLNEDDQQNNKNKKPVKLLKLSPKFSPAEKPKDGLGEDPGGFYEEPVDLSEVFGPGAVAMPKESDPRFHNNEIVNSEGNGIQCESEETDEDN